MLLTCCIMAILAILQVKVHHACGSTILPFQKFHAENLKCTQRAPIDGNRMNTVGHHWMVHNVTSSWHCLAACQNSPNCSSALLPRMDSDTNPVKGTCPNQSPCYLYSSEVSIEPQAVSAVYFCILDHIDAKSCSDPYPCYLIPVSDSCAMNYTGQNCPKDSKHYVKINELSVPEEETTATTLPTSIGPIMTTPTTSAVQTTAKGNGPPMDTLKPENSDDTTTAPKPSNTNRGKISVSAMLQFNDAVVACRLRNGDILLMESKDESEEVEDLIHSCDKSGPGSNCDKSCYWINLTWRSQGNGPTGWLMNGTSPMDQSYFANWNEDYTDPSFNDGVHAYIDADNNYKWTYPPTFMNSSWWNSYNCLTICEAWN